MSNTIDLYNCLHSLWTKTEGNVNGLFFLSVIDYIQPQVTHSIRKQGIRHSLYLEEVLFHTGEMSLKLSFHKSIAVDVG